jgi:DNA-binding GntR family transcriptional regulator
MSPVLQALDDDGDRSLAAVIARQLAAGIVSGALAPGERLRQDHVAAAFRASHVPVREAFRRLEAQGLAVAEPRRGVRVAPLHPADILETAEMRAALEGLALRHALARMTAADLDAARASLDQEAAAGSDLAGLEAANRRFHTAILAPCAMPRLLATVESLHAVAARHLFAAWRHLDWEARSASEHRAVLAAVEARDRKRAATLLAAHILAAGRALAAALDYNRRPLSQD